MTRLQWREDVDGDGRAVWRLVADLNGVDVYGRVVRLSGTVASATARGRAYGWVVHSGGVEAARRTVEGYVTANHPDVEVAP